MESFKRKDNNEKSHVKLNFVTLILLQLFDELRCKYQNNMSQMVSNKMDGKSLNSTGAQQHSTFQQQLSKRFQETEGYPSTQMKSHFEQPDINHDGFAVTLNHQQRYEFQRANPGNRRLSPDQSNNIESKEYKNLPKSIQTQIQPGPTQKQLAQLTKQQRQLLSRGKDIMGYIHSNEEEFYQKFNKKEVKQMDQELRSLYLFREYGGPFDYTAIQFNNYHIRAIEKIVNKAEEIVPRLKSWIFKTIKFFVPETKTSKPNGNRGKYQQDSCQDQDEKKNLKDQ